MQKSIFSHMHVLYFYDLTEELPYRYTMTASQDYYVKSFNRKCQVFYAAPNIYGLRITEVKTPEWKEFIMVNSVMSVKDKLHNRIARTEIDSNMILWFYMYDRFIERLSKSRYQDRDKNECGGIRVHLILRLKKNKYRRMAWR